MSKMLQSFSPESDGYQFMWIILVVFMIGLGFSIERIVYIIVKSSKGRAKFLADRPTSRSPRLWLPSSLPVTVVAKTCPPLATPCS